MNAATLALIAVLCFATENVLISRYFGKESVVVLIAVMHSTVAITAISVILVGRQTGHQFALPQGSLLWILIACALLFAVGDFFYLNALGTGRLATVTMIACVLPVAATIISFCIGRVVPLADEAARSVPTMNEIVGWVLGAAAVAVVTLKPFSK